VQKNREYLKCETNERETTGRTRILETCTQAEINLKKVASLELNKGLEGQLACRFPQYFEQVDKSLLSVTECTRD